MTRLQTILNSFKFSSETLNNLEKKKTEKGMIKELSCERAYEEAFPDCESIFLKVYEARRRNADDLCKCQSKIGRNYKRISQTKFQCLKCKIKVSPMAGTPLEKLKYTSLKKFLRLAYLNYQARQGFSTKFYSRTLSCKYESVLGYRRKMHKWMQLSLQKMEFNRHIPVQIDEVFPPVPSNLPKGVSRTRGLGSEGIGTALVETQSGGIVKVNVIPEANEMTVRPIINSTVPKGSQINTDGKYIYNFLSKSDSGYIHEKCNHKTGQYVIGNIHVNHAEAYNGIAKNQIKHIHNGVSEKHLEGYLNDTAYAFSHRFSDFFATTWKSLKILMLANELRIDDNVRNSLEDLSRTDCFVSIPEKIAWREYNKSGVKLAIVDDWNLLAKIILKYFSTNK